MTDRPNRDVDNRSNLEQRREALAQLVAMWRSPSISPAWFLISVAWIAVLFLSHEAAGDRTIGGDVRIAHWIQDADSSVASTIADVGNLIGTYWFGALVSVPVVFALALRRRWSEAALFLAILAGRALNNTVKGWIGSPRPTPDLVDVRLHADGYGFPSGHAFGAMLLFGALALVARIELPRGKWRNLAVAGFLALILIVGFGRIYVGVHWPSDVLGGYLMGGAVLLTLVTLLKIGSPPRATQLDRDR